MVSVNETELVCQARRGDSAAFDELVRPHLSALFRLILALANDRDDAEDCLQEALVRAYQSVSGFRADSSFSTWLYRIALNVTKNWVRSSSRHAPSCCFVGDLPAHLADPLMDPERATLEAASRNDIRAALVSLPPHYREPLLLRYYHDMSYEETAAILQVPIGTVRSRISQAKALLHQRLASATFDIVSQERCER